MSFLSDLLGSRVQVPAFPVTDYSAEQIRALSEDIKAFPEISQLSDIYQNYMMAAYNKAIPGFSDIMAQGGALTEQMQTTAAQELAGKIPDDVAAQVARSAAFKSLGAGTLGGPMATGLTARDLGITSFDVQQRGAALAGQAGNAAQRWAGLAQGLMLSPAGNLVTPAQQAQFTAQQNILKYQRDLTAATIAAGADPQLKGLFTFGEEAIGTIAGSALGTRSIGSGIGGFGGGGFGGAGAGSSWGGGEPVYPSAPVGSTFGGWTGPDVSQMASNIA